MKWVIGLVLLGLVGCASAPPAPVVVGPSPPGSIALPAPSSNVITAKSVAAAGQSLTLAMEAVTLYMELPRCDAPEATVVCSDRAVVRQLRLAAIKAHNLLIKARRNEAFLGSTLSAISTLRSILPIS